MLPPTDAFESDLQELLDAKAHLDCNDVIQIEPLGWLRRKELVAVFEFRDRLLTGGVRLPSDSEGRRVTYDKEDR